MKKSDKSEPSKYWMEGMAFGLADGIICCLGLIIGVAEATMNFPALERMGMKTRVHTKREVLMSGIMSFSSTLLALLILILPFIFLRIGDLLSMIIPIHRGLV